MTNISFGQSPRYTLGDWDNKAAVRTRRDHYRLPDDLEQQLSSRDWFPPAFIPYVEHPLVRQAGRAVAQRLAANHLLYFLDYTTMLEHRVVNRSVETIIHGELAVPIPRRMKTAALQLYTDEGYHALFSNEVAEQIANLYGIDDRQPPRRINRLLSTIDAASPMDRPLAWLLLGFVSETIIARELLAITRNTLVCTVYRMLRNHLEDEARHSRYFSEVFQYLWSVLDSTQRDLAAGMLLHIIGLYFEPDDSWLLRSLASVGFDNQSSRQIVSGLLLPGAHARRVRCGAVSTFAAMSDAGFFDNGHYRQLFSQAGFIDG
ncbi:MULTISPECIES: diiron oxygenase [Pseudomonas]|uniref:diiron oxygenase n=1 Tax=Pseudomonas TaxID=286 RepID=UPI000876C378|nr:MULTISPECIES: diiron oxygenase [Pseudomonas]MDB6442144.1 diiron oxygenase [Pseudomonas sp. 21TX0197]MDT8908476.1 diiron oxygenase [Pseudomonas prosekii]NHN71224.1 diiron oxygenase [Pseudomonas fluorescens]ROO42047.1 aminobenzoate oxygenase [Pseudomonas sp. 7SR1]SCX48924.1 P-aminobenzoate N-oxygenase AurF [Pseudomonas sp. NFACC32-1]